MLPHAKFPVSQGNVKILAQSETHSTERRPVLPPEFLAVPPRPESGRETPSPDA